MDAGTENTPTAADARGPGGDGRAQKASLPPVTTEPDDLRRRVRAARAVGRRIGLVPTMGALHAGHLSLVEACQRECDFRVTSIFVNPTQFGPGEDYQRYPRDLQADRAALAPHDVDLVFAPPPAVVYPAGYSTYVEVGGVTEVLEGACRPGHFRGVATVVLKLLNLVAPDVAYFGHKDYQQTVVVRRLVEDLNLPVSIRVCPTVREPDGLALSSRNAYLQPPHRAQALVLIRSLQRAAELVAAGERDAARIVAAMRALFDAEPDVQLDYAALVDPHTLNAVEQVAAPTLAAVAARVGGTRLIDNQLIAPP